MSTVGGHRALRLLLWFFGIALPWAGAVAQTASPQPPTAKLDQLVEQSHERGLFNGVLLVTRGGKPVYQRAIGPAAASTSSRSLTTRDRFSIGSIGKEFSAVALLLLGREGKLRFEDPVAKFVPGLPDWGQRVRVRHLLDYTSGLPGIDPAATTNAALMADLRGLAQLKFEPGTDYFYSNNNIVLRRLVIEAAARTSYARYVQTRLLGPCGMRDTILDPRPSNRDVAWAFDNARVADAPPGDLMRGFWIYVNAQDLFRWSACLQSGRLAPVAVLTRLANTDPQKDGALGRIIFDAGTIRHHRHQGSNYNYEAWFETDVPSRTTVVVLTNNKNFRVGDIARAAFDIVAGKAFETPKRSLYLVLRERMLKDGFAAGMAEYQRIRMSEADAYDLRAVESDLNRTAYFLVEKGRRADALPLFRHIVEAFPDSANAWDSLGEALEGDGQRAAALASFRKALALDPTLKSAHDAVARLSVIGQPTPAQPE